ncbi:hypothetical protein [Prosthecobacter sp.]|uniref:hypothetical protein n=1 Tax=Prosthecobacter sp. TaxID=1965333 RepID=UPI0037835127
MKTAPDIHIPDSISRSVAQVENCVRKNPGGAMLVAAGIGVVAMLLTRALQPPPPPRSRAQRLLEDIQERLNHLVEQGSEALSHGMESVEDLHLERKLDKIARSLKNLFH